MLRHVQKCQLALCSNRLYLIDFSWPQLPALTAMHIEARLTTTGGLDDPVSWNNNTVRDLSVTVLRTKEHCLAHGVSSIRFTLALSVASSCLETLCVRAVVAETGLLAHGGYSPQSLFSGVWQTFGVYIHLQLSAVPHLRQLLVCSHAAAVCGGQKAAAQAGGRPTLSFSGVRAACLTNAFGVELNSRTFD